jgi:hypothetical protein
LELARTPESTKHPALALRQRQAIDQRAQELEQANLVGLPGWEALSPDEKKFLLVLQWTGGKRATAEFIGKNASWYERRRRENPMFRGTVDNGTWSQVEIARQFGVDRLGRSMLQLNEFLDPLFADKRLQLDAIKHLHRVAGLDQQLEEGLGLHRAHINTANIVLHYGPNAKKPEPIEAEAQVVDEGPE